MKRILAISTAAALTFLTALHVPAELTPEQAEEFRQSGLSPDTIQSIEMLEKESGRRREPAIGPEEAAKLLEAGFGDRGIRLFVALDRAHPHAPLPLTPQQALAIVEAGVSPETVSLLIESLLQKSRTREGELGRKKVTRPDGKKVIIYQSGAPRQPVTQTVDIGDGRKMIVYRSGDPNRPAPKLTPRRKDELAEAVAVIERLKLDVNLDFLR